MDHLKRNVLNKYGLGGELAVLGGRWVAVRDDHVVADATTLRGLLDDERVRSTDTRFAVPAQSERPRLRP